MKIARYDIWAEHHHELSITEYEDGEWVKWEDVEDIIHAIMWLRSWVNKWHDNQV